MRILKREQQGFTLVEILIVIAIIGILVAIAIPQFSAYRKRAYYSSLQSDVHSIANAQEAYYTNHNRYASVQGSLFVPPYSVCLSSFTDQPIANWNADAISFSFTLVDSIHVFSIAYRSVAGGIQ